MSEKLFSIALNAAIKYRMSFEAPKGLTAEETKIAFEIAYYRKFIEVYFSNDTINEDAFQVAFEAAKVWETKQLVKRLIGRSTAIPSEWEKIFREEEARVFLDTYESRLKG